MYIHRKRYLPLLLLGMTLLALLGVSVAYLSDPARLAIP